jgi:outer membrane protein insertion porin family
LNPAPFRAARVPALPGPPAVLVLALVLLVGALLPAGTGRAEEAPAETVRAASVDFGPDAPLPAARLEAAAGIRPGGPVSPALLAEAIRRLVALPEVRRAEVRTEPAGPGEVAVWFRITPTVRMSRVLVEGARRLGAAEVERVARLAPGDEVDEERLDQVRDAVEAEYARKGYFSAHVTVDTVPAGTPGAEARTDLVNVRIRADEGRRALVESIRYTGMPEGAGSGPWLRSMRVGRAYDADRVRKDEARMERYLAKKGYLNPQVGPHSLSVAGRKVAVVIPVRARERVHLTIDSGGGISKKEARGILNLTGQRTLDDAALEEARLRLLRALNEAGYRSARVTVEASQRPGLPEYDVAVRVKAGKRHRVAEVRFEGNLTFSSEELAALVQPGFRLTREPVREGVIQRRADSIEGALMAAGFPDASVTYAIQPLPDKPHLAVITYYVDEGRRWWVREATVEGLEGLPEAARNKAAEPVRGLPGVPYRRDRVRSARAAVASALANHGYVDAEVETLSATEDVWRGKVGAGGVPLREVLVDLTFRAVPGPRVRVGQVTVAGTFRTRPYVVTREITVHPGDLYTPRALAETRRRLFRAAAFDRVRVGPSDPEDHSEVRDVSVELTEGRPGAVELGIGYAEEDGVRGLIDVSYRDLFRRGHRGNVRLRYGQLRRSATLGYVLPWIGPFRVPLHTRLLYEREDLISYERVTWAGEVGIRRPVFEDVVLTVTYRLERNRFPRLPADQVALLPERRRINVGSIFTSLVRDTRDDPFAPRVGTVLGATYEQGAHLLASQVQFAKVTLQAAGYTPVSRDLVLAGNVRTGRVRRLFESTEVPVSERFFLGGQSSIRGYALDSVGVDGETVISGVPQGGKVMILSHLELRSGGRQGWGFTLFADAGNVWNHASSIGLSDFRVGAGPGLTYNTPVGPLRLDLGYKVDRRRGEDVYRIHFTLGNTF